MKTFKSGYFYLRCSHDNIKRLLKVTNTKIRKNKLTNRFFWACSLNLSLGMFASDGLEYSTRNQAIDAYLGYLFDV